MTEFMSRRERREAEKAGRSVVPTASTADLPEAVGPARQTFSSAGQQGSESGDSAGVSQLLSRRELRERERSGTVSRIRNVVAVPDSTDSAVEAASAPEAASVAVPPKQTEVSTPQVVLPEVSLGSQVSVVERPEFSDPVFSAEPSTNSIVLDRIPDAVGVPIEVTGEIITTGSIAILTEPVNTVLTGPLDDRALDSISANEAVTGAITVVEPVSALQVIKNRPVQSVLPVRSLRSGWWKPLLLAAATLAMVAAAVTAALVIINTLGL